MIAAGFHPRLFFLPDVHGDARGGSLRFHQRHVQCVSWSNIQYPGSNGFTDFYFRLTALNSMDGQNDPIQVKELTMTPQGNARIFVSIWEGKVEIEGSEQFVANHLAPLQGVISEMSHAAEHSSERQGIQQGGVQAISPALEKYMKLFNTTPQGEIELLKELPGNNMANKTVSAALLISYANSLLGAEQTPLEVIRKACKQKACHDSNNFSATIRREKELFVHSGRSYIQLSETGKRLAQNMAEQLIHAQ